MTPEHGAREAPSINKRILAEMIARAPMMGEGWRLPVLHAAHDGRINLMTAAGGMTVPARVLTWQRPTLCILADDTPDATGPGGWPQAAALLGWARALILHAAGGEAVHSAIAVRAAEETGRALLVEMELRHQGEWLALARRIAPRLPMLNIVPPPGVAHPAPGAPAGEVVQ